jgi:hypothetical protein
VSSVQLSPDGRFITFRATTVQQREPARYAYYAAPGGVTEILNARPKTGEPRDVFRMGVVAVDPTRHPDSTAVVTDWFHYSDSWTSRILNLPQDDPDAFRLSSPICHAVGLVDPLRISHGAIDDNGHLRDAMRLVQRLIELEKRFEVMYYPVLHGLHCRCRRSTLDRDR